MQGYQLQTEMFEGPLELLLTLIEKKKLLINDISLAEVTDDYLKYIEHHTDFPIQETAQFVLVGSTLLLLKSHSLLPVLAFTPDEQESMVDLETRLLLLDRYKGLGKVLGERFGTRRLYSHLNKRKVTVEFTPDSSTTTPRLREAIRSVIEHLPKPSTKLVEATVEKVISIEEMMDDLTERINSSVALSFRDASDRGEAKVNVIVTFLAMLELVRQGVIRVEQHAQHGDITMHRDTVAVPSYT